MMLTYDSWDSVERPSFSILGKTNGAEAVIKWAYEHYQDELIYSCSFGVEAMILLHLISNVKPDAKVIFLDTYLHFSETYEVIEDVKQRFPKLNIQFITPPISLVEQEKQYGAELWKTNPDKCCEIRKIKPLEGVLFNTVAWISGLRREQSTTRQHVQFINKDNRFKSVKVCPLIHWTWKEVWDYVKEYDLPYNKLHDQGYPSIGCYPCTKKASGDDLRSGRWTGTQKTECGLHKD